MRLFDFSKGKTGNFSKITGGGSFKLDKLIDNTLIFQKRYQDMTKELEVDIDNISVFEFGGQ